MISKLNKFEPIVSTRNTFEKFQDVIFRWKHHLQKCYELDGNYVEK